MKVKVIKAFIDREADMLHRKIGDEFEVDEKRTRFTYLNNYHNSA